MVIVLIGMSVDSAFSFIHCWPFRSLVTVSEQVFIPSFLSFINNGIHIKKFSYLRYTISPCDSIPKGKKVSRKKSI
jgi:hypothetical protein